MKHRISVFMMAFIALAAAPLFCVASAFAGDQQIILASDPAVSPDGKEVVFTHRGDLWKASTNGGRARRLTVHNAGDRSPRYSPDGKQLAFVSDRTGADQVFVMPVTGGSPQQLTFHSEGFTLEDWYPDGSQLLVMGNRDHFWRSSQRFFRIDADKRSAEKLLFNDYGYEGRISPDGRKMLFVREGEREWRKGYRGARAAQIWLHEFESGNFRKVVNHEAGSRTPAWATDGSGFYYCTSQGAENGARNLWYHDLNSGEDKQLTSLEDDLVTQPVISADGTTIVFRHLFDLYRWRPGQDKTPERIRLTESADDRPDDTLRRTLKEATDAAFSSDGLEVAFIAGGDLWVMETELREPVQITTTAEFESDPVFVDDGAAIILRSWKDGQSDLYRVERSDAKKYWWQNTDFQMTQLTNDAAVEFNLKLSPNGEDLAYLRERGDLWIRNLKSGESRRLVPSFSETSYDFSPDGRWLVYATMDNDFNSDIWIAPIDQSAEPVNISRHPDVEGNPVWSPDGKVVAFTGRRSDDEVDIYYVWLNREDEDLDSRDRKLSKTAEAFRKARSGKGAKASADPKKSDDPKTESNDEKESTAKKEAEQDGDKEDQKTGKLPEVVIDFEEIHRRLHKISIEDSSERGLSWSPDGKTLVFSSSVKGESGTYSVTFPDKMTPSKVTSSTGSIKSWLASPNRILWLNNGTPGVQPLSGSATSWSFSAAQETRHSVRRRAAFEEAWRTMRDRWYDNNFGNHNWDQIRRKYVDAAESSSNEESLKYVVELMLGELNGSHLGFYPSSSASSTENDWRPVTVHPGLRFDLKFKGPGLRVKDVIPGGPAEEKNSRIEPGEIVLSINGTSVDSAMDLTTVLTGRLDQDLILRVKSKGKKPVEREVALRPTTYARVRSALYQKWQDDNRKSVERRADNIGYLHIQGMNWPSFLEFERELYDVGYGKDGLIIDVRDNGGGFTTDHLLTALTQPRHAVTVPRGGGAGYPQDRMVYATWDKPIVVMCNQNSYSNAEIFSHAIKGLGRGKLVGVPTAGGVISTGGAQIMDMGFLRLPFRGWFLKWTGEDMELNGAVPDVVIWPMPNEIPNGRDRQLGRAVQVLQQEIKEAKSKSSPTLMKVTGTPALENNDEMPLEN
ncbi:MAG: S41 family peptidase [Planctomycetaceae bacterium]